MAGDAISYWVGRHFQEQLRTVWPFRRHPGWLKKGEAFLGQDGGKGILLGRFCRAGTLVVGTLLSRWRYFEAKKVDRK